MSEVARDAGKDRLGTTQLGLDAIGSWTPRRRYDVSAEAIAAYAAATNEVAGDFREGKEAPPLFAVVPARASLVEALRRVVPPDRPGARLHGEQDLRPARPIRPGDEIVTRARPLGIRAKRSGSVLAIEVESLDGAGEPVNSQYVLVFVVGLYVHEDVGGWLPSDPGGSTIEGPPLGTREERIDPDQTFRYASAAGDETPIHVSEEAARAAGLPGIIVHGLCTLAIACRAVVHHACPGEPARLTRIAARFSSPAFPGDAITTTVRKIETGSADAFAFETVNTTGARLLTHGRAEVSA